ncbi:MAG TPA: biopolymer transporter ExbD [Chitinophagaceae bacterium]|jgi:biopolymer transport protein ExbD|nr:biopolymer transporter ExbD [Chitinophagaceae bacterium]
MAEILNTSGTSGRKRAGVRGQKKHFPRTDMTPMVDLGFLLITFFVFTATLSEPRAVNLNMPTDEETDNPTELADSNALTILLDGNDRVFYYAGKWENAVKNNTIKETSFSYKDGLGDIVRAKQQYLDKHPVDKDGRDGLMLLIKAGDESKYANVIDALDEALINEVKRYAIVKMTDQEKEYLIQH